MTFGVANRPSTPMFDIIENKFQKKWIKKMYDVQKETEAIDREVVSFMKIIKFKQFYV